MGLKLIELVLVVGSIAYLFNYYYFQQSEFKNFIVSSEVIWISFIVSAMLFGIGAGARFILSFVDNFIPTSAELQFKKTKEVYDVFSKIWVNITLIAIFFIYSLMEVSKPIENLSDFRQMIAVYSLSALLGIIFAIFHKQDQIFVQRITMIAMIVVSVCLGLFIFETGAKFLTALPVSTSFVFFNGFFLLASFLPIFKLFSRLKASVQKKEYMEQDFANYIQEDTFLPFPVNLNKKIETTTFPEAPNNIQISVRPGPQTQNFNFIKDYKTPQNSEVSTQNDLVHYGSNENFYNLEKDFSEIPESNFSQQADPTPDFLSLKHLGTDV